MCLPNFLHHRAVLAAAKARKHIIVEKPLALSLAEVREIEQTVRTAGVGFCICFELRFSAQFRIIKDLLEAGRLGRVHYGEIDYYHGIGPWYGQFRWNTKKEAGGSHEHHQH